MKNLSFLLLLTFLITSSNVLLSQSDTIKIYDEIHMKDGRVLKGEILSYQESDGFLVFRDIAGRKYSFSKNDYDYFIEDKRYVVKTKAKRVIHKRKEKEYEFTIGTSLYFENTSSVMITNKTNYYEKYNGNFDVGILLRLGFGKYLDRRNFVGITTDIALTSYSKSYFNTSLRYSHQMDGYKNNISWYVPVQLHYNYKKTDEPFSAIDSIVNGETYYDYLSYETKHHSVGLEIGTGISFHKKNKKSFSIELSLFKNYVLSSSYKDVNHGIPMVDYKNFGMKLAFLYNL